MIIASLIQIAENKYFFLCNNKEEYFVTTIFDNKKGVKKIQNILKYPMFNNRQIIICMDELVTIFDKDKKLILQYLINKYGNNRYNINYVKNDEDLRYFSPKKNIDYYPSKEEICSALLLEKNSPTAFFSYLNNVRPPFHPFDGALFCTRLLEHPGFLRVLCSNGLPPSSQDVENLLHSSKNTKWSMIGTDVLYAIIKNDSTPSKYNKEEFYLAFFEVISEYKQYGKNLANKIAILEICKKYNLYLVCTSFHSEKERIGENIKLWNEEDFIIPNKSTIFSKNNKLPII